MTDAHAVDDASNPEDAAARDGVGPVLHATELGRAVAAAIAAENDGVVVRDESAYLRVSAPRVCRVSRAGVESSTGYAVLFPGDLEVTMPSFAGKVAMNENGAVWWLASEPRPDLPAAGSVG